MPMIQRNDTLDEDPLEILKTIRKELGLYHSSGKAYTRVSYTSIMVETLESL